MRLHRLTMTAIGPFAGRIEIDLARFGESGLFLLEGPTGSGKSTVLDAISFALYGKVGQSSAVVERLKSHHAPAGTEPVVELVFETQSGLYRVRRTPSYERPKKRGAGFLTANMTVKLWRLSPDDLDGGELISNSIGDAEDEITRAVGLTHAQFVQTVVLPQGEFANFLRADTTAKRALLQRLFGTELLARTQANLVEGKRAAEVRRSAAVAAIGRAVHSFAGVVGLLDDELEALTRAAEAGDRAAAAGAVSAILDGLRAAETAADDARSAAVENRLSAQQKLQVARELAARRDQRAALRAEHQTLLDASGDHDAGRDALDAAERALTVVSAAESLGAAIQRSDSAQDAAIAARGRLDDTLTDAGQSALRDACDARQVQVGELTDAVRRERELAARRAEFARLQKELKAEVKRGGKASIELGTIPPRQSELAALRELSAVAAAQLPGLTGERDRALARLDASRKAVAAARIAAENQQLMQEALDAAVRHESRLMALRTSWRASIASELGLALQSGEECVVCGSMEHPKPAQPAAGHVSQDDVNRAEKEWRRLNGLVDDRRDEVLAQRNELERLQIIAESLSPELAQVKLDSSTAALATAQAAADQQPALAAELRVLTDRLTELSDLCQAAALAEARLTERLESLLTVIEQDDLAVAAARADYPTVADRVAGLTEEIRLIDEAALASSKADTALGSLTDAGATFVKALATAGFDDQAAWQQARLDAAGIAALRTRLAEYDQRLTTVVARLSGPELTDPALDAEPVSLTELATAVDSAQVAESAAAEQHGAAHNRRESGGEHADRLARAIERSAAVLVETAAAIRVGNLVAGTGENQLRMELTTYVLVRRFAEIVSAANTQLRRISGGRYELDHTDARSGNARSGLGLRVLDLHTGRPRETGTLSGGETFYVSLSLALGLADIVRAESGGIDLGTLFIDEGFGTLDPEVLDQVLAVLDGLREGGRAVGIVSHVSEIKVRIPDQIQVRPNPDGSSRLVTTF